MSPLLLQYNGDGPSYRLIIDVHVSGIRCLFRNLEHNTITLWDPLLANRDAISCVLL